MTTTTVSVKKKTSPPDEAKPGDVPPSFTNRNISNWGYVQQEHCLAFQAKVEISTHTDDEMMNQKLYLKGHCSHS
jgi:hypothetical protein